MNPLRKQVFLFFLILYLFTWVISAQDVRFQKLTINDGLSQNVVFAITQDSDGFMWFATKDGLNRYDGYSFTIFQNDVNDKNSIASNYITTLFNDRKGTLWIGTDNGVVHTFNKNNNTFQRIYLPLTNSMNKNTQEITTITQDQMGSIWIGTKENGLFKIPTKEEKHNFAAITQFYKSPKSLNSIIDNTITKLHVDDSGILWIATNKGLSRMDSKKETFMNYTIDVRAKEIVATNSDFSIESIIQADKNQLWLGTRSGLVLFDTQKFTYEFYPHHLSVFRYGWGDIKEIVEDKKGNLWLATSAELMRFDKNSKTYQSYKNDPLQQESLNYNSISSLFIDHSNILWVGTTGMGINYYDPKSNRFSVLKRKDFLNSRISGFSIRAIVEENDRYVWIGAEVLYRWDRKTNTLKSFETNSKRLKDFGNTGINSIIKSKDNLIWVSSTEGLFRYDTKSEKATLFSNEMNNPNSLPNIATSCVFESKDGNIWVVSENYISKMTDRENGVFKNYNYRNASNLNFINHAFIYEDETNNLWIATRNGLIVFNPKKETFHTYQNNAENKNSLNNNTVYSIAPDPYQPNKYLWIGTSGGLNRLNLKNQTFTHFTQKDGLPNNVIYGILSDPQNNLWLSTNKGLSKFNPKEKTFRNYDIQDGLQSNEFNTGAFYKSNKGELFFGGISGLNYFFPEQVQDNPYLPAVAITGIKVYSENKEKKNYTEIREITSINDNKLTFTHRDNIIIFEFASLDFSSASKNKYAYILENFNDNWIYVNNNRTATFTNLPPGKYTFKIKGSNNDGVWNEKETSMHFQVLPHWTGTLWAYLGYFLVLLCLLYLVRKYEMKRMELKTKMEMEHKEFDTLRVLDQLKTRFFTNISHELRTPLTLISGNVENLLEENHSNTIRNQVTEIDQNTKHLLKLINQLLDISKLEAGKMELNKKQNNIVAFLKNLVFAMESICEKRGITLNFISETDTIQAVYDPDKMEKIIMNLLSNALKFTNDKGKIVISIATKNNATIRITVSDNGIGIKPEAIPYIFNRFYQVDNSDTRTYEGTGIGLTLVKELIELHKGSVKVYRNEELSDTSGTTFVLEMPIGEINPTLSNEPIPKTEPQLHVESIQKLITKKSAKAELKKIVLVVEDNWHIRAFIKQQLHEKYKVIEASNGREGITKAQNTIPDIIISDVMMPEMDGYSMIKVLKNDEMTSHIPIVVVTGKSTPEDKIEGLENGIDAFITKPFSIKELQLTLSNLMHQREQLRMKFQKNFKTEKKQLTISSVDELFLEKTIQHINDNIDNSNFSVELLAQKMCLSPSQLHRKIIALLDLAPGQLIRNIRLERSADLILQNAGNIAEICYQTGFNDQTYFSRAFKNQFGCSPSSYKKVAK